MTPVYFDANATEMPRPEAQAALLEALGVVGNPSSVHKAGRAARARLEEAREEIAALLGGSHRRLIFTSGGTEANALAIHAQGKGRRIFFGATEHESIRAAAPGGDMLPVEPSGVVDLGALDATLSAGLAAGAPALVCLMLANNETGVLHPIADVAAICRRHGALLHVDAVQAFGRIPVSIEALGADSLSVSAHKLGGPIGAGALLFAKDVAPDPLVRGGGQELGWRGGTQAWPSMVAFAAAARAACAAPNDHLGGMRDRIASAAIRVGAVECGGDAPRLPNTVCLALPGASAQTQLIALDMRGMQVSAGSACSSGKVARSTVLSAMGLDALADQAIRISLPWSALEGDIQRFIDAYVAVANKLAPQLAAAK